MVYLQIEKDGILVDSHQIDELVQQFIVIQESSFKQFKQLEVIFIVVFGSQEFND